MDRILLTLKFIPVDFVGVVLLAETLVGLSDLSSVEGTIVIDM